MPCVVTNLTQGQVNASQGSYTTASVTITKKRLATLEVWHRGGEGIACSGWTQIATRSDGTSNNNSVTLFRRMSETDITGTHTITFTANPARCGWSICETRYCDTSGTNGSGAIVQHATADNGGGGTSITVTLAAFSSANNATFGTFVSGQDGGHIPGVGFTELAEQIVGGSWDRCVGSTEWKDTNDTTVDVILAYSAGCGIAIEIKYADEAAAGVVGKSVRVLQAIKRASQW